jgi:hypothetical protein
MALQEFVTRSVPLVNAWSEAFFDRRALFFSQVTPGGNVTLALPLWTDSSPYCSNPQATFSGTWLFQLGSSGIGPPVILPAAAPAGYACLSDCPNALASTWLLCLGPCWLGCLFTCMQCCAAAYDGSSSLSSSSLCHCDGVHTQGQLNPTVVKCWNR